MTEKALLTAKKEGLHQSTSSHSVSAVSLPEHKYSVVYTYNAQCCLYDAQCCLYDAQYCLYDAR